MTVRVSLAPQAPGYVYSGREEVDCEQCGNAELVLVFVPGRSIGRVFACPCCTRRGARDLYALLLDGVE